MGTPEIPVHCGGYHPPHISPHSLTDLMGSKGERVCLFLSTPKNHQDYGIGIADEESPGIQGSAPISRNNMLDQSWSNIQKPGVVSSELTNSHNVSTMNLSNILDSQYTRSIRMIKQRCDTDDGATVGAQYNVPCIIQEKTNQPNGMRFGNNGENNSLILGLNPKVNDSHLWDLIHDFLPLHVYENILSYMDYDHVKWLVDNNERFARLLAHRRYNIKYFLPYPSLLLAKIRQKAAREMRFAQDDDMWIASLDSSSKFSGTARRFRVKEGDYSWFTAASNTRIRFDVSRAWPFQEEMEQVLKTMADNQEAMLLGKSRIKIFSLKGVHMQETDNVYSSPHFTESAETKHDYDYLIHMSLDTRWLVDLKVEEDKEMYNRGGDRPDSIVGYNTMIFKDPVRFFGTTKLLRFIDSGIFAFICDHTCEVLGYLVKDKEFRFRMPVGGEPANQLIGLTFLPSTLLEETKSIRGLVTCKREFEVTRAFQSAIQYAYWLEQAIKYPNGGDIDVDEAQRRLDEEYADISRFEYLQENEYPLTRKECLSEWPSPDVLHIHETYEEGFDFCTRYSFNCLGYSKHHSTMRENIELFFSECSYERQFPDERCTWNIMNPSKLRMLYTINCPAF